MIRLFVPPALLCLAACSPSSGPEPEAPPSAAVTPAPSPNPTVSHRYTRLDQCRLVRSAPEEAGFFEHECAGEGGWRLKHVEADLRENLTLLAPGGGEHDLDLSALASGAFSSLGDTVEWRGPRAKPVALILRQSVMEDPDPAVPEVSYLVAVRLAPVPCVIARIAPGPGQNEQARMAADRGGTCLAVPR